MIFITSDLKMNLFIVNLMHGADWNISICENQNIY